MNKAKLVSSQKPQKRFEDALFDFMCMAKGRSQSLMIRYFLEQVITHSDVCEQGSILVYSSPPDTASKQPGDLKLYDRATNSNSLAHFPGKNFKTDEGLGGLVFRKRRPVFASNAVEHPDFVPLSKQDIGSIYCVPIILEDDQPPFGIVSFHNPRATADRLDEQKRALMDIAVKALEVMLPSAPIRLVPEERLFIVHGRDEQRLEELTKLISDAGFYPVTVKTSTRTGQDLLTFIEKEIRGCVAGFVLLTPDDEGRLCQFGEPLRLRARQNVIFEGGYLTALFRRTNRICFLQQGKLEIPSDLHGLLMERFDEHLDRDRIIRTIEQWGLEPTVRAGAISDSS